MTAEEERLRALLEWARRECEGQLLGRNLVGSARGCLSRVELRIREALAPPGRVAGEHQRGRY